MSVVAAAAAVPKHSCSYPPAVQGRQRLWMGFAICLHCCWKACDSSICCCCCFRCCCCCCCTNRKVFRLHVCMSADGPTGCRLEVLDCGRVYIHFTGSSPRWGFRLLLTPLLQRLTDTQALRGCNLHLAAELSLLLAACTPKHKHAGKCNHVDKAQALNS